jgi:hypothetical protein
VLVVPAMPGFNGKSVNVAEGLSGIILGAEVAKV